MANTSSARDVAVGQAGIFAAHCSAASGVWPAEMSQTTQHAASIQTALRVGQAQSTTRDAPATTRTLSEVQSVCSSVIPDKNTAPSEPSR